MFVSIYFPRNETWWDKDAYPHLLNWQTQPSTAKGISFSFCNLFLFLPQPHDNSEERVHGRIKQNRQLAAKVKKSNSFFFCISLALSKWTNSVVFLFSRNNFLFLRKSKKIRLERSVRFGEPREGKNLYHCTYVLSCEHVLSRYFSARTTLHLTNIVKSNKTRTLTNIWH